MTRNAQSRGVLVSVVATSISALLVSAGGAAAGAGSGQIAAPVGGQIVFVSTASGGGSPRIELVDSDASHRRVLAEGRSPAWSPDGKRLAFWKQAASMDDLFVLDVASGRRTRLLRTPGWERRREPAWSPDGHRIAFVARQGAAAALTVVRVDSRAAASLAQAFFDSNDYGLLDNAVSWSPDGRRIAFVDPQRRLAVADAVTGTVDVLEASDDGEAASPSFSPDGQLIAFALNGPARDYPPALRIIGSDGSGPRVAAYAISADGPHWSPGGTAIAVAEGLLPCDFDGCDEAGTRCPQIPCRGAGLLRMDPSGDSRMQLTDRVTYGGQSADEWPAWSGDGRTVAFVRSELGVDPPEEGKGLWLVGANGHCPTRISSGRRTITGPVAWRPGSGSPPARHCSDLRLRSSSSQGLVGGRTTFTYDVTNTGDRAARNVVVAVGTPVLAPDYGGQDMPLRKAIRWMPSVQDVGGRLRPCAPGTPARCSVGSLRPGAKASVVVHGTTSLTPGSAARRAGIGVPIWSSALVTSIPRDADPTNDYALQEGAFWYCTQHLLEGADRLVGTSGPDLLCASEWDTDGIAVSGGAGDDVLVGSPGPDVLDPGPGRDVVRAGDGDDIVTAADGEVDVIVCGGGSDRVTADAVDRVDGSCETVERV